MKLNLFVISQLQKQVYKTKRFINNAGHRDLCIVEAVGVVALQRLVLALPNLLVWYPSATSLGIAEDIGVVGLQQ